MEDLLVSLSEQRDVRSSFEVVLIDNNREPRWELMELVRRWEKKLPVRLIHVQRNGLHHARHAGAGAASGEYLVFVDDDVRMPPTWLFSFERFFASDLGICAGGKVIPEWDAPPPPWLDTLPSDILSLLDYGDTLLVLDAKQGINGCNFAIRKDVLYKYGGFNPDGFIGENMVWYRGDGEYGLIQKLKAGGEKVYYLPNARLQHRIPGDRIEPDALRRAYRARAISSAYHFFRARSTIFPAAIGLFLYGSVAASLNKVLQMVSVSEINKMICELSFIRNSTFARYGLKIMTEPRFRKYVKKPNYLDE